MRVINQRSFNFVLWAIPRFHRTGPVPVVTTTSHDTREGIFPTERRVREEDKAKAAPRRTHGWRYALS